METPMQKKHDKQNQEANQVFKVMDSRARKIFQAHLFSFWINKQTNKKKDSKRKETL